MPKVSEEHLEARRHQIVDAAFRCFAEKGFHPTTMQDICTEAGLSPGAVYRYFASKEDIILSACDASQEEADAELLRTAMQEPDTARMLTGLAREFFSRLDGPHAETANRAVVQLWAEQTVNQRVHDSYESRRDEIAQQFREIVVEAQRRGDFARDLDPDAVVHAMFALHDGFRLEKATRPEASTERYVEVVEALLLGRLWTGPPTSRGKQ